MTVLDKLERRIGFIAIPHLIRIVVGFTALVCVLAYVDRSYLAIIDLNPELVKRGQLWRLVTYIFIPSSLVQPGANFSVMWALLALWFLWFIGEGLERAWGAFRVTLYFLVGMIGTTIAAFFFGTQFSNTMLLASLFFAFAHFYPDEVIYVLFVLPMKFKWLAWIIAAFLIVGLVDETNSYRVAFVAAFSNYLIFFGPEIFHQVRHRKEVASRRQRFEVQVRSDAEPLHHCATCGRTELSDPNLEFRVSRNGEEYCMEHLPSAAAVG
jgi:membrane associated rhomboid family serine protease